MAATLFSVSNWLKGAGLRGKKSEKVRMEVDDISDLMSCTDLSSNCVSDEESLGSSSAASSYTTGEEPESPQTSATLPTTLRLPPTCSWFAQTIQAELQRVLAALPADAPPAVQCHALGYALQAKWKWPVKFCCRARIARLPNTVPCSWLEDVMVILPAPKMHCVVDLRFRDKFIAHCPGVLGDQYTADVMKHVPSVYVGLLSELFRDVDLLSSALEAVFRESGTLLPPWRSKATFRYLYKYCAEHDATDSQDCLRRAGEYVASSIADDDLVQCVHCTAKDNYAIPIRTLRQIGTGACAPPAPTAQQIVGASELADVDFAFEKDETSTSAVETVHSGLSFLLRCREDRL
eukprot:GGOE01011964.1.p1 GENE.GGOE01011964.1~~GGOE01011964.1.p1  ORF type:complete len:367 (+),score=97.78 GGOE01011964.1:55-1101(+)